MRVTTTITMDSDVLSEARYRKINISRTLNNLLKAYMDMESDDLNKQKLSKEDIETELEKQRQKIARLKEQLTSLNEQEEKQNELIEKHIWKEPKW